MRFPFADSARVEHLEPGHPVGAGSELERGQRRKLPLLHGHDQLADPLQPIPRSAPYTSRSCLPSTQSRALADPGS